MPRSFKPATLVAIGAIAGVLGSFGYSAMAQREGRTSLPLDDLRQFSDVFGAIKSYYVEPVEDRKLIQEAISGMVTGLDPHSTYLDADAFKELQVGTQGEFGGLGIEVGSEDGFIKVVSPIEDTPAAKAGVRSGDLIVKIDDKPTKGMSLSDAVKLMRGKPKTPITLTMQRKGETRPVTVTIIRDVIKVQSVRSKTLEPGVAYLRITQFQEHTVQDLVRHLRQLGEKGAPKGLVLDLRNDPGGLLNSAVGVTAAFIPPRSLVVSTDGRTEDAKRKYIAAPEDYLRGTRDDPLNALPTWARSVKIVVLTNAGSASASEIVAGALQDHKRASVLGTQTFGKGSVQSILPLSNDSAIKLTTARYYTPAGRSIQARGIVPDYVVDESAEGDVNGFRVREADLQRHLMNDKDKGAEIRSRQDANVAAEIEKLKDRKPIEFGTPEDYQLQQALNLLKGSPVAVAKAPATDSAAASAANARPADEGKTAGQTEKASTIRSIQKGPTEDAPPARPGQQPPVELPAR